MAIIRPVLKTLSAVCDTVILYSQSTNRRIKIRCDYVKYQSEREWRETKAFDWIGSLSQNIPIYIFKSLMTLEGRKRTRWRCSNSHILLLLCWCQRMILLWSFKFWELYVWKKNIFRRTFLFELTFSSRKKSEVSQCLLCACDCFHSDDVRSVQMIKIEQVVFSLLL